MIVNPEKFDMLCSRAEANAACCRLSLHNQTVSISVRPFFWRQTMLFVVSLKM